MSRIIIGKNVCVMYPSRWDRLKCITSGVILWFFWFKVNSFLTNHHNSRAYAILFTWIKVITLFDYCGIDIQPALYSLGHQMHRNLILTHICGAIYNATSRLSLTSNHTMIICLCEMWFVNWNNTLYNYASWNDCWCLWFGWTTWSAKSRLWVLKRSRMNSRCSYPFVRSITNYDELVKITHS